jgi:two-component system phosphate regulon sensor histidine kinase PhoR
MKVKKSYSFALKTSFQIAIIAVLIGLSVKFLYFRELSYFSLFGTIVLLFLISFIIIQIRIENFIYQRVKKIYQEVSLLDIKDLKNTPITSDMETLSKEVSKFATEKLREIQNLNEQAKYRREFLGNVAHELKTPLFSIQGYLLTLLDGALSDKNVRKKYVENAAKNVERLVNIVEDLDTIAKIESKTLALNIQEFDIIALTKSVFEMTEMKAYRKYIEFRFDKKYAPINVLADSKKIEQVLENLITNAIKYGKQDTYCLVKFEKINNQKLLVSVIDKGEGIAQEHLPRIFERFYRIDSGRSREEGGSGLGLSIVKHIIEAHKETIDVKSVKGKGSEFSFTLELA